MDAAAENPPDAGATSGAPTSAAERALSEAAERRKLYEAQEDARPRELGGRGGKEPGRYGDWEVKGLAVDF